MNGARPGSSASSPRLPDHRRDIRGLEAPPGVQCEIIGFPIPITLNEVGTGGFSVVTSQPIHTDSAHVFRFTFADGAAALISAEARHTRCTLPKGRASFVYITGFSFCGTESIEVQRSIDALIERTLSVLLVE